MTVVGGVNAAQIVASKDLFNSLAEDARLRKPSPGLARCYGLGTFKQQSNHMTDETPPEDGAKPRGRFQKGQSGNPKGRPKMPKTVKEVRDLAREHTPQMIEVLSRVALNPKSPPAARVQAASSLIDRGWGRAPSGDLEGAEALVIKVLKFADHADNIKVIEHDEGQADG